VTADSGGASHSSVPVHLRQQKKLKTKAKPFIEPTGVHVRINHISAKQPNLSLFFILFF